MAVLRSFSYETFHLTLNLSLMYGSTFATPRDKVGSPPGATPGTKSALLSPEWGIFQMVLLRKTVWDGATQWLEPKGVLCRQIFF